MLVLIDVNYSILQCDQNGVAKCNSAEGPAAWATSFEKLLEDPAGLHTFAVSTYSVTISKVIYVCTLEMRMEPIPDRQC